MFTYSLEAHFCEPNMKARKLEGYDMGYLGMYAGKLVHFGLHHSQQHKTI